MSYQDTHDGINPTVYRSLNNLNVDPYRSATIDSESQPNQKGAIGKSSGKDSWSNLTPQYELSSSVSQSTSQEKEEHPQIFTDDLPSPTVHLEKTSFSATGSVNDLGGALVEYFTKISKNKVDCHPRPAQCRIAAISYHADHEICKFRINFYREKKQNEKEAPLTIVEFQRLSGNTISFVSFYFELLRWPGLRAFIWSSKNGNGNTTQNVGSSSSSLFPLLSLGSSSMGIDELKKPSLGGTLPEVELAYDEATMENFFDMAISEDLNSQRESAKGLATISMNQNAKSQMVVALQSMITVLKVLLQSSDYQTSRNAAVIIVNLMEIENFKNLIHTHLISCLNSILNDRPNLLSTRDLKRQVKKILQVVS